MIPLNVALRTLAASCRSLADTLAFYSRGRPGRQSADAKLDARGEAIRRLRGAADRLDAAAKGTAGDADPAAVGYLAVWIRGHSRGLPDLLDYLRRRQSPAWEHLRDADASDKAAVVLAALGL